MTWTSKLSLILIFALVFSTFMYQGWYQPKRAEAAVSYVGEGAFTSGTAALTVPVPASYQANDVFLLFVESAHEAISTPVGWTDVVSSPQFTGTAAAAGGVRLAVFYKVASAAESDASVADAGDVLIAISSSGRSENILLAVKAARTRKCSVITLSGFDPDNPLSSAGDFNFYVPSHAYGPVEVIHHSICHCLLDTIIASRI